VPDGVERVAYRAPVMSKSVVAYGSGGGYGSALGALGGGESNSIESAYDFDLEGAEAAPTPPPGDVPARAEETRRTVTRSDATEIEGADLDKAVRSKSHQVQKCFDAELAAHPGLSGRLVLQVSVGKDGAVATAAVKESTVPSAALSECVARKARKWKFRSSGTDSVVEVPFVLSSK
jgi:outer membrane biosynthesis protein TonB